VGSGAIALQGYEVFRQDRNAQGGGVAMYCKTDLKLDHLDEIEAKYVAKGLEVCLVRTKLERSGKDIIIIGVYRPPQSRANWFENFNELILEISEIGLALIMGDLNGDLLHPTYQGTVLQQSLALANTYVPELFITRLHPGGGTCLDIIALPKGISCSEYKPCMVSASDHFPVQAAIPGKRTQKTVPVLKRSFKRVDMADLKVKMSKIELPLGDQNSPEVLLQSWQRDVAKVLDEVAPKRLYPMRKRSIPWMNENIRRVQRDRDNIAKKHYKKPFLVTDDEKEELRLAKRRVKSVIRREAREYGQRLIDSKDTKAAWKFIRSSTFTTKRDQTPALDIVRTNEYFASIVSSQNSTELITPRSEDTETAFEIKELDEVVVLQLLMKVNPSTSSGQEELPAFLVKELARELTPNITAIFNRSITCASVPDSWKKANITAIWKGKGSKKEAQKYRPISVLPLLGRVLEKAVAAQLSDYCEGMNIIPQQQFGFRRRSNCEMALLSATNKWMKDIDEGLVVGALLIDLSKAFDTVPHQQLLLELMKIGCGSKALQWFTSYLTERKQRVVQRPQVTSWKAVTRGVPQGSGLSPLLFNVFVRDIPSLLDSSSVMFADDITESESDRDIEQITSKLGDSFKVTKNFCDERA